MPTIPDDYIKETVKRLDNAPQASRLNHPGYVHVSSLINVCARQYALAHRYQVEVMEASPTGGHRVMWKIGRAVEKHVRSQFIVGQGRQGIYGVWKCMCGRIDHLGMFPARTCNYCGEQATKYCEPVLHDDENKIVGSPDITFLVGRYYFVPVELKSMNKTDWDALEAPVPDHIAQAAMYRHLYSIKGYHVHDNVKFVYTTKDFKWGDPYKEYQVDCTQEAVVNVVNAMVEAARRIRVSGETRTLPNRTVCRTAGNSRAKACPVAHLCFSMGESQ
ncbi:exonuclease [Rhizobium phage vB_RleS_L338C]|uniref:exonuclease n=1 Tax=Rhizobium phage vB_RleS_L338C TaxID=1414737 RepID=UPI0003D7F41F|nr:exonuclease [Rhizobium phage vB_RleS_L338C]AHC30489.1 hypothetical protein L338C_072 [Rhizobium phage vB_RleS_L338C]